MPLLVVWKRERDRQTELLTNRQNDKRKEMKSSFYSETLHGKRLQMCLARS